MADLKKYVTEELNPENQKDVDGAEVLVPSTLLSSGMSFVDTPGLGSVFTGNTATTQAFTPHIDAALVRTPRGFAGSRSEMQIVAISY